MPEKEEGYRRLKNRGEFEKLLIDNTYIITLDKDL